LASVTGKCLPLLILEFLGSVNSAIVLGLDWANMEAASAALDHADRAFGCGVRRPLSAAAETVNQ